MLTVYIHSKYTSIKIKIQCSSIFGDFVRQTAYTVGLPLDARVRLDPIQQQYSILYRILERTSSSLEYHFRRSWKGPSLYYTSVQ